MGGELTYEVPDPKRGLGEGRCKKPIFTQNTSRVSSVRGVHLEGQNLIRGDHKGRSKIFTTQYMQSSYVQSLIKLRELVFEKLIPLKIVRI